MISRAITPLPPVLVAVRDLREELRAGFGEAMLTVRTLDGVSLALRMGELVVLRGGVASGATSLLHAMSGARPVDRRFTAGIRVVAPGVQIRRACISLEALHAMLTVWSAAPGPRSPREHDRSPVVYAFRVRPSALNSRLEGAAMWAEWAERLRARGGSVLAQMPLPMPPTVATRSATMALVGAHQQTVREPSSSDAPAYSAGHVRLLTLSAGRIVSAQRRTDVD